MKALPVLFVLILSLNATACPFSIIEQNDKFFLILKRVGELPGKKEHFTKDLRRGLQEVDVKEKDKKEVRKVRVRVIHDSDNREQLETILKSRCSSN